MTITILTAALVALTGYYAYATHQMVVEMRSARAAELIPRLMPIIRHLPAGHGLPGFRNVGSGPALDVDINLSLEPDGPVRRWKAAVEIPGAQHELIVPDPNNTGTYLGHLDAVTGHYRVLRISGSYADLLGTRYSIDEELDLQDVWGLRKEFNHAWHDDLEQILRQGLAAIQKSLDACLKRQA